MASRRDRIGIVGAGQLARMMIEAATPLDLNIALLAVSPMDSAARIWPDVTIGSPDDVEAVAAFARGCDVITFDHELVPEPVLARLEADGVRMAPSADALRVAQNKRRQRELFAELGLPQPEHRFCESAEDARRGAEEIGYPVIVKAAQGGYDGRGVWSCPDRDALEPVAAECEARGIMMIVEERVPLDRELAILVARNRWGVMEVYPVVETLQLDGICRQITFSHIFDPAPGMPAAEIATTIAAHLDVVGIMALELLETDGRLLINEIAVRPHNSGHYSIEAITVSQFENHLRAILGLPLGSNRPLFRAAVTVNILGPREETDMDDNLVHVLQLWPHVSVHLYGKDSRPGRKIGHVTVAGYAAAKCADRAWTAVELLTNEKRPESVR